MRIARVGLTIVVALGACTRPVHTSTTSPVLASTDVFHVTGVVLDERTDRPLLAVAVSIGDSIVAQTDGDGRYRLRVPQPGIYWVGARRIGYHQERRELRVVAGHCVVAGCRSRTDTLHFRMRELPIELH